MKFCQFCTILAGMVIFFFNKELIFIYLVWHVKPLNLLLLARKKSTQCFFLSLRHEGDFDHPIDVYSSSAILIRQCTLTLNYERHPFGLGNNCRHLRCFFLWFFRAWFWTGRRDRAVVNHNLNGIILFFWNRGERQRDWFDQQVLNKQCLSDRLLPW